MSFTEGGPELRFFGESQDPHGGPHCPSLFWLPYQIHQNSQTEEPSNAFFGKEDVGEAEPHSVVLRV